MERGQEDGKGRREWATFLLESLFQARRWEWKENIGWSGEDPARRAKKKWGEGTDDWLAPMDLRASPRTGGQKRRPCLERSHTFKEGKGLKGIKST